MDEQGEKVFCESDQQYYIPEIYVSCYGIVLSGWLCTHGAGVIAGHLAEEELRAVRDGLPCSQGVDVLLPVFHLQDKRESERVNSKTERTFPQ